MKKKIESEIEFNFHDCQIFKITKLKNGIRLYIKIDTYWFPGKKVGLLDILDGDTTKFEHRWNTDFDGILKDLYILKKSSDYLFNVRFQDSIAITFMANDYKFRRVDYEDDI